MSDPTTTSIGHGKTSCTQSSNQLLTPPSATPERTPPNSGGMASAASLKTPSPISSSCSTPALFPSPSPRAATASSRSLPPTLPLQATRPRLLHPPRRGRPASSPAAWSTLLPNSAAALLPPTAYTRNSLPSCSRNRVPSSRPCRLRKRSRQVNRPSSSL